MVPQLEYGGGHGGGGGVHVVETIDLCDDDDDEDEKKPILAGSRDAIQCNLKCHKKSMKNINVKVKKCPWLART